MIHDHLCPHVQVENQRDDVACQCNLIAKIRDNAIAAAVQRVEALDWAFIHSTGELITRAEAVAAIKGSDELEQVPRVRRLLLQRLPEQAGSQDREATGGTEGGDDSAPRAGGTRSGPGRANREDDTTNATSRRHHVTRMRTALIITTILILAVLLAVSCTT